MKLHKFDWGLKTEFPVFQGILHASIKKIDDSFFHPVH